MGRTRMHADEIFTDADLLRRLLARARPGPGLKQREA